MCDMFGGRQAFDPANLRTVLVEEQKRRKLANVVPRSGFLELIRNGARTSSRIRPTVRVQADARGLAAAALPSRTR